MAAKKLKNFPLLNARQIAAMKEVPRVHRLNPHAIRNSKSLGDALGMLEMGIHLVRIKPGDLTTEYHTHHCDEEFVYILSGKGIAEIGGRQFDIGAGDFMGFIAGAMPHAMSNPHKKDLVYLLGGTRKPYDVSDYPRAGVRTYKFADQRHTVRYEHATVEKPIARSAKKS